LEYIRREAARITGDLSAEDWRRAADGKWCTAQILEHLMLTYTSTTRGTLRTMESGEVLIRKQTLRERTAAFLVIGLGVFPSGRKATKQATPNNGLSPDSLRRFNDALVAMDATLNDAERRFGGKTKMLEHPVLGPLTVNEWRRFHRIHAKHHFRQVVDRARA
jgi:hypothetical protein